MSINEMPENKVHTINLILDIIAAYTKLKNLRPTHLYVGSETWREIEDSEFIHPDSAAEHCYLFGTEIHVLALEPPYTIYVK